MIRGTTASADDLDRAAQVVETLAGGERLASLVYDVLSRQAEGRTLFAGEKFVLGRGQAHGVERAAADTPYGNLLEILERGPDSSAQWALCGALCVRGFGQASRAEPAEKKARIARFAAHCDFLELGSPYRVLSSMEKMIEQELAAEVYRAFGALVLRDDAAPLDAQARAQNAGRIAVLAKAGAPAAREALQAIHKTVRDAFSRTLCALSLGQSDAAPKAEACTLRGRAARFPGSTVQSVVRWITGIALLASARHLLLAAIGWVREIDVELADGALRVQRRTLWIGRLIRRREELYPLQSLVSAKRAVRYPTLGLAVGTACFALGFVLGGLFAFDAARAGDASLWLIAAALVFGGAGIDLALDVIIPGSRGRVAVLLEFQRKARVQLCAVPLADAELFLETLWRHVAASEHRIERAAHAVGQSKVQGH